MELTTEERAIYVFGRTFYYVMVVSDFACTDRRMAVIVY